MIQLKYSGAQLSAASLANDVIGFKKNVSRRDIISTYPYPNSLVVCMISGAQLKEVIERSAEYLEEDADGNFRVSDAFLRPKVEHYNFDFYAGLDYKIDFHRPLGDRVINMSYQGIKIQYDGEYSICLNNYRASGAGGYPLYKDCKRLKEISTNMTELIFDYFKR